ncbi:hypothetical protein EST38_g7411 [Candolleomyces aberdarensis]|uniref:Uncharacterized protein n=1 Tax=Candolleomyces aberdarensis TaxID=2316362 RepID=A0A4Q2DIH4_9AGAR|nr:hypothetical protein EST38_g7411 [Candolleomyces aberdarensis]
MPASVVLNPASSSSNPATSSVALWAYLKPALDHIVRSPSNDPNGKAPAVDFVLYSGIHTACYNYFTAQSEPPSSASSATARGKAPVGGSDIYDQLDRYFAEVCQEIALNAPEDESTLVHYLVPSFNRFSSGAQSANRLLSYVNRHYVKRAVDEDRGWLRLNDVLESMVKTMTIDDTREKISQRLKEKRTEELKRWGYAEGDPPERLAVAEACSETASPVDRIVPVASLAHRRFRTEVIEPMLLAPKTKGTSKAKHKIPKTPASAAPYRPKGRLARAVQHLMTADDVQEEERTRLLTGLAHSLKTIGVRPDHPLRKRMDKHLTTTTASSEKTDTDNAEGS